VKTLSLTNLDRISELDFNRTSSTGGVGGSLSVIKIKNLEVLKAQYNNITKVLYSTTGDETNNKLSSVDLSYNNLSTSEIENTLSALDTLGLSNGTIQLGGTNSLPTRGNYNTEKLSLESKGWTVGIAGGIDTEFGTNDGYSEVTADSPPVASLLTTHPDWEGRPDLPAFPDQFLMDAANNRVTCKGNFVNCRHVNPIKAQVGSKILAFIEFDFGSTANNPDDERTFMLSLTDMGAYPQADEDVQNHNSLNFYTKFFGNNTIRLRQRVDRTNPSLDVTIGTSSLQALTGDRLRMQFTVDVKETAAATTVTISFDNITDSPDTSIIGLSQKVITGIDSNFYNSLISPTSNIKMSMQAGELDDTGIGTMNVYKVIARSIWP